MAEIGTKKVNTQKVAYIAHTGIYTQMGPLFAELGEWLQKKNAKLTGVPWGLYYDDPTKTPPEKCKAEACFPISGDLTPEGKIAFKELPAAEVAWITHKGPYDQCRDTYNEVFNWVYKNQYQITGPCREVYLNSPYDTKPEDLLTEIQVPVTKQQSTGSPSCGCTETK